MGGWGRRWPIHTCREPKNRPFSLCMHSAKAFQDKCSLLENWFRPTTRLRALWQTPAGNQLFRFEPVSTLTTYIKVGERNRQAHVESSIHCLISQMFFLEFHIWDTEGRMGVESMACQMAMTLLGEQRFGRVMSLVNRRSNIYRLIDPGQVGRLLSMMPPI